MIWYDDMIFMIVTLFNDNTIQDDKIVDDADK
jgi:hypothetical protein